jgi:hypothetical protein
MPGNSFRHFFVSYITVAILTREFEPVIQSAGSNDWKPEAISTKSLAFLK